VALHVHLGDQWRRAALGTLVWRHPLADVAAKAAAPNRRRRFTLQCLITGSLWGRPMWGT